MKAIAFNEYGSADKLALMDLPVPEIGTHQVLVQSKATSINPIDWKLRQGYMQRMFDWQFPIVVGWDIAGIITAVGSEVTDWHVGDEVFARPETTRQGTYAEFVAVDDHLLAHKPENVTFAEAAAVPLAGLTAWQGLFEHGELQHGQRVLIQAGAGGVGTYAIQLAKHAGAEVWTTASPKNDTLLHDLGADVVVDYHDAAAMAQISNMDLVLDTIGGQSAVDAIGYLKTGGKQISITGTVSEGIRLAQEEGKHYQSIWLRPDGQQLAHLATLMAEGALRSVIAEQLPFSLASLVEAHHLSETGHTNGKIVITFD